MKSVLSSTIIALSLARRTSAFIATVPSSSYLSIKTGSDSTSPRHRYHGHYSSSLQMSSSASSPQIISIDKSQMNDIISETEESQGNDSKYTIIDVRNVDEINFTGKLSPVVHTLPLPYIAQYNVFGLDDDDFEEQFGFSKPGLDQTIVFTCKAGIRSMHAAQFASQAGYTNLVSYSGGADEWFR